MTFTTVSMKCNLYPKNLKLNNRVLRIENRGSLLAIKSNDPAPRVLYFL